jgi:hypothetical protein
LVSGKLPFESDTDYNLMQSILKKKIQPPDKLNPSIPKALSDIILKALEKNPDNRYQTARAFQQALIAAFPNYRDIDLNVLRPKQQQTVLVSQYTADGAATRIDNGATLSNMQTKMEEAAKPFSMQEFFQEKVLANKKLPFILAGIGLLFFLFIIISVIFNKGDNNNNGNNNVVKTDTVKKDENSLHGGGSLSPEKITPPHNSDNSDPALTDNNNKDNNKDNTVNNDADNKTVKQKKKKQEKRDDGIANNNNTEKKDGDKPVVKDVPPVVVVPERKTIYIESRVEVNLYLRENLGEGDGEKERSLTFSVTSAVYYQGAVIIRQGSIARGDITIGRMQTSVNINSVMAANGQWIQLYARLHRRRRDLQSDRNYTAILERGTRINFQ